MNIWVSLRILGVLLMLFSSAMLVPMMMAIYDGDHTVGGFLWALVITFTSGLLIWIPARNRGQRELMIRDGFMITSLFWTVLGLFGALPFVLTEHLHLTYIEAAFE
jgi:trk system potassium uptake protein TrkH